MKTEAHRLADELESDPITNRLGFALVAADELRRLDAVNAQLLAAMADIQNAGWRAITSAFQKQSSQPIEHCLWARNGNTPCPHTTTSHQLSGGRG